MSSFLEDAFPALDCHAHIAPDVTAEQISALGGAQVIAVTRTLDEADAVRHRSDAGVVWACGVHPGRRDAGGSFDRARFERLLDDFPVVGEIGLDKRGGNFDAQKRIFRSILQATADRPVLLSIHSAGAVEDVLSELAATPQRGAILLHWFLGDEAAVQHAIDLGAFFSVNAAMPDEAIMRLPRQRVLPETDFPARRGRAKLPGDTRALEQRLATMWQREHADVRAAAYRVLREAVMKAGCLSRLPEPLSEHLLVA